MLGDERVPSPDHNDSLTLNNGNGSDPVLATGHSQSNVVTLMPFSPPAFSVRQRKKRTNVSNIEKNSMYERLPGLYEPAAYSKFLTLDFKDKKLDDVDIFELNREITECIKTQPKISPQGDGALVIEVSSPEESEKLQKLKLNTINSKCIPHVTLNKCKGVVYSRELIKYSEEKLLKEFENQKVSEVKRIMRRVNEEKVPTPTLILTFELLKLPSHISAAWYRLPVKPYIPTPRRCYHCQMFGHVFNSCRSRLKGEKGVCVKCGDLEHGVCDRDPKCFNCKESHSASDKKCQRYLFEKEILTIKTKENISFRDAREKAKQSVNLTTKTFAQTLKNQSLNQVANANKKDPQRSGTISKASVGSLPNPMKRTLSKESVVQPPSKVQLSDSSLELDTLQKNVRVNEVPASAGASTRSMPAIVGLSASPEALPSASPEALPSASPEALSSASPEALPSASTEALPSASPEALPSASAEALASASMEALPSEPSAFPEALASASSEASARASLEASSSPSPPASPEAGPSRSVAVDPSGRRESLGKMEVISAPPCRKQVKKGASVPKSSKVNSRVLLSPRPASSEKSKRTPKKLNRDPDHKDPKSK